MVDAGNYRLVEQVGSGGASILWRAVGADERSVILKQLREDHPAAREMRRLGHELDIGRRLQGSAAAVQVLGAQTLSGHPTLVLEDFHGRSLDQLLGRPLPVSVFLKLGIALAHAVAEVHRREIIHRDLKPRNIIVDQSLQVVKLADFGIASLIPVEQPAALPPNVIEGTPPYMSPEQTGRMNRVVDYRTDLYSLGVTLYEMLTGRLPFTGRDTLEWFHAHLAKAPVDPGQLVPDLPPILCAIVLRLLAKGAEDRYQSARGLEADLQRCLDQLESNGRLPSFPLGAEDVSERFQIPQKLYGREAELATLLEVFDRVAETGQPQLILVAGYSGIGKSALVRELHRPVVRERGYFLSGKFDQYNRDVPYSTITQAFRELVQQILAEGEPHIAAWRQQLQEAVGVNGRLIVDIIPPVEMLIGPQPAVPELPATEAQNRLQLVFQRFLGVCATREHPVVLFLDDLQWVDAGSLRLLEHVITHPQTRYLMLIGAYRDNEVGPGHPLLETLERIPRAGAAVRTVTPGPLSRAQLRQFVADTLHRQPTDNESQERDLDQLAQLVHLKTEGNPFFFIHFLRTLHQEGLLELEPRTGGWTWDIKRIEARGFADNVVDLMVGRLGRLPAATREVLRHAACLGSQFTLATMATICQQSEEAVDESLREALRERQVSLSGSTYQFVHDRVQQAAYLLNPADERGAVHLRIGRLLSGGPQRGDESVFDVVNQLNQGVVLITDAAEKAALCRLNVQAGRKAMASIAYASARRYLSQAQELWPSDPWGAHHDETLTFTLELSECEYLIGNSQRAKELQDLVLQNARSTRDRARAYRQRIRLYQASGQYLDSVAVALEALRCFGLEFPANEAEIRAAFVAEHQEVAVNLRGRPIADICQAGPVRDPEVMVILGLLIESMPSLYIARPSLFGVFAVRAVNLSLCYGNSEESSFVYTVYGMLLAGVFGDFAQAAAFSEMSLRLNDQLGGTKLRGSLLFLHASFINCWRQHIATSRPLMEQAFAATLDVGDLVYAGYNRDNFVLHAMERGDPLDQVSALAGQGAAFARQSHLHTEHDHIRVYGQWAACLAGATRGATSFDDDTFSEAVCLAGFAQAGHVTGTVCFHIAKQWAAVVMGDWPLALACAEQAAPLLGAVMASPITATHHFHHALTLAALHAQADGSQGPEYVRLIADKCQQLARWSDSCPENYRHRHALVSAELARIEGRNLEAMRLYEEAIRSAGDHGFVHHQALAHELAAGFYRARGLATSAEAHLRQARAGYVRWRANAKVKQLDAQNPTLKEVERPATGATVTTGSERLDFRTAIKASQAISSQIVLDQLLETLMRVVLENAGARRGGLVLPESQGLAVAADAQVEGQEVSVRLRPPPGGAALPWSILNYVRSSRDMVLLADAAAPGPFAGDEYVVRQKVKSVLCLPILRQGELIGILYLENALVTDAFTTERLSILELLAAQVAISLENALLLAKEQAARAAAEAAERRSAFLAHELMTPLGTVKLRLGSLRETAREQETITSASLSPALAALSRQFERLNALIENLLESTRVQTGQLTLSREEVDLTAVLREVIELLAEQAERAGCQVHLEAAGPVLGRWDHLRLEQVATNLLTNAFKYGAGKPVHIVVEAQGPNARFTVSDEGIGISDMDQTRLFEPFVRATDLHQGQSLGVGLYLVREILQAHGGRIQLSSRPGAGTTFIVELPREAPAETSTSPAGAQGALTGRTRSNR